MKTLLTTLNSKFIHSNLAIRYLKSFCIGHDIKIKEYTINDNLSSVISDIFLEKTQIIAFSCYIWNIEQTLKVVSALKTANKDLKIVLGGPEVSYDPKEFLEKHPEIDFIVFGEGEISFKELIDKLEKGKCNFGNVDGLAFRENDRIIVNKERELIHDLDIIDFPYSEELHLIQGKMVYYEASRGCPFNCQYCLSSTIQGVRYFSMDRVKNDLKKLINAGVSQVKFVDRTFNCHKGRTIEILKYLLELRPNVNFHFEIAAEHLDNEIIELLKDAPEGLFQFEIGVQSTNVETLDIISRNSRFDRLSEVVNKINSYKNIHLHLDLIAGLPKENYESFKRSFNDVYKLKPQMLQLGFLKLLRGSGLRLRAEELGIRYRDFAPYEVLATAEVSFDELIRLKDLEEILERYSNSGRFSKNIYYIINKFYKEPFDFFEDFSAYWRIAGLFEKSQGMKHLYSILKEFVKNKFGEQEIINELIKFDYLSNEHAYMLPDGIKRKEPAGLKDAQFEFLKNEENVKKYLPKHVGQPAKWIVKQVHIEEFSINVLKEELVEEKTILLFDYEVKNKTFRRSNVYDISREIGPLI